MQANFEGKRALLVRIDRIGDLALTLPAEASLPGAQTRWWIAKGLGFMAEAAEPPRAYDEAPTGELGFFDAVRVWVRLWRAARAFRPDLAIVFHAPWWAGAVLWAAGVPIRVGPLSQWHSFVFYNRGVRQKRSRSVAHEREYNALLIEEGLGLAPGSTPRPPLEMRARLPERAREALLARHRLRAGDYFVVHPGMAGSALNWPTARWTDLIRKLSHLAPVAITGTGADEAHLAPLRPLLEGNPAVRWLDGQLKAPELLALLAGARGIAAPSTGVLHLAAALGRPTVGLYSPVPVQAPRRWGPLGPRASSLAPNVDCPGHFSCLGPACPMWNCMERIEVEEVLARLRGS